MPEILGSKKVGSPAVGHKGKILKPRQAAPVDKELDEGYDKTASGEGGTPTGS